MGKPVHCGHCREVIGVYEPMVVLTETEWRLTSPLNERSPEPDGDCFHATCFHSLRAYRKDDA